MNCCPLEVLHQICSQLDFKDVASFRRVSRSFADIGTEHLTTKAGFHFTEQSLQRFSDLAKHPIFSQTIRAVVFEGLVLSPRCEHIYTAHFNHEHGNEKPQPPTDNCTPRERRLYKRNLSRFKQEIQDKYQTYRSAFQIQQTLLDSSDYLNLISTSIKEFSHLQHVKLSTVARCQHSLSKRFNDAFTFGCSMPMSCDTSRSISQLQAILFPDGNPVTGLKKLEVYLLSPWFFVASDELNIPGVFRSLEWIELSFRLEDEDHHEIDMGIDSCYSGSAHGNLHNALAAAQNLRHLTINFDDHGYHGSVLDIEDVLGQKDWPLLTDLNLNYLCAEDKLFLEAMQRQPMLKMLRISYFTLTKGTWEDVIVPMKRRLNLELFYATGVLFDDETTYQTDLVDRDHYVDDYTMIDMTAHLDMFVTYRETNPLRSDNIDEDEDTDDDDDDSMFNPLTCIMFEDMEELIEEFGSPPDSEDGSEPCSHELTSD